MQFEKTQVWLLNNVPKFSIELSFLSIMVCAGWGWGGGSIHWSLQFGLTWRLLYWLADTKSNENTDQSSMLAISNSLISIP